MVTEARTAHLRRGLHLEAFTIAWNLVEAVVGFVAGIAAGSVALVVAVLAAREGRELWVTEDFCCV